MSPIKIHLNWTLKQDDYLALRYHVLSAGRSYQDMMLKGDDQATHVGIFVDHKLIGCFSLFDNYNGALQLRKFAILPMMQRKGIGSFALRQACDYAQRHNFHSITLDARLTAIQFYEKNHFYSYGEPFFKGSIRYIKMKKDISNI